MSPSAYATGCDGCAISQRTKDPKGRILVDLPGDWTLNHYGGSEGYLGWLALQTRYHRMSIPELTPSEASALGPNIQRVDLALRQYWDLTFKSDLIRRVYVLYAHEGPLDRHPSPYHLHFHLISRPERLDPILRDGDQIICWDIYKASKRPGFPVEYAPDGVAAEALMTYLQGQLTVTA